MEVENKRALPWTMFVLMLLLFAGAVAYNVWQFMAIDDAADQITALDEQVMTLESEASVFEIKLEESEILVEEEVVETVQEYSTISGYMFKAEVPTDWNIVNSLVALTEDSPVMASLSFAKAPITYSDWSPHQVDMYIHEGDTYSSSKSGIMTSAEWEEVTIGGVDGEVANFPYDNIEGATKEKSGGSIYLVYVADADITVEIHKQAAWVQNDEDLFTHFMGSLSFDR